MILFIHPQTEMLLPEILPMSLPALLHRLEQPVTGRFHDEWTPAEVRRARIVLMDVHWYLSLRSAIRLSHQLKQINPNVVIIAGGLSASIFPAQLLRDAQIDYIIRGDAELPLKLLVEAILQNAPVETIPNLVARDFVSPMTYALTGEDLDQASFRDLSFFPSLEQRIRAYHRWYRGGVTIPVYPYLMVFRGCPLPCPLCSGSVAMQQQLFGRGWVLRSPARVQADLAAWSDDPHLRFVNIFHDFVTTQPLAYTAAVLSEQYDLDLSYEFFGLPTAEQLALLLAAFRGGKLLFCLDQRHNTTPQITDVAQLIQRIKQAQTDGRYQVVLGYVRRFLAHQDYRAAFDAVRRETQVATYRADFWWDDFPQPGTQDREADYRRFLAWHNQFSGMNRAYRLGLRLYRWWPALARSLSHRLFS